MIVVELFLEFALLSLIAFGGATALLPEMHRVVVENHKGNSVAESAVTGKARPTTATVRQARWK